MPTEVRSEYGVENIYEQYWQRYEVLAQKLTGFARGKKALDWLDLAARETILPAPHKDVLADEKSKEVQYENLVQAILLYCLINIMCDDIAETAATSEKKKFMDFIYDLVMDAVKRWLNEDRDAFEREPYDRDAVRIKFIDYIKNRTATQLTEDQQSYTEHLVFCIQEMFRYLEMLPNSASESAFNMFVEQFQEMFNSCFISIHLSEVLKINVGGVEDIIKNIGVGPEERKHVEQSMTLAMPNRKEKPEICDDDYLKSIRAIEVIAPTLLSYINLTAGNMGTGVMVAAGAMMMSPKYVNRSTKYARYLKLARLIAIPGRVANDFESLERELENVQTNGLIYLYVTGKNEEKGIPEEEKIARLKEVNIVAGMVEGTEKKQALIDLATKILSNERVDAMLEIVEKGKDDIRKTNFHPKIRVESTFVPRLDNFIDLSLHAAPDYIKKIVRARIAARQERERQPLHQRREDTRFHLMHAGTPQFNAASQVNEE